MKRWSIVITLVFSTVFFLMQQDVYAKELLFEANSSVKQTKFVVRSGELIFTEKYQNIHGKITQSWNINNSSVEKDDYFKKMTEAEKEEEEIAREVEEKKKREEEQKAKELLTQKKKEQEAFVKEVRLQTLKRMVKLELEKVEESFLNLDKYKLEEYFVFEDDSFSSLQSLNDSKISLVSKARELTIRSNEQLTEEELKDVLVRLEAVPDKVEKFFRQSVKYAINHCNDTKRLKELLALI